MVLGDIIRQARERKGLSLQELADAMGISKPAVSKWENSHSVPERKRLTQLSGLLGISMDRLAALTAGGSDPEAGDLAPSPRVGKPGALEPLATDANRPRRRPDHTVYHRVARQKPEGLEPRLKLDSVIGGELGLLKRHSREPPPHHLALSGVAIGDAVNEHAGRPTFNPTGRWYAASRPYLGDEGVGLLTERPLPGITCLLHERGKDVGVPDIDPS